MEDFWARKFEHLLELYRRDDGSKWSGAALERATGGIVNTRYVSELRRGIIKEPSFRRIHAISRAMGVPLDAWLDDESVEGEN